MCGCRPTSDRPALLALLRNEDQLERLERSGRLLRRRFHGPIFAVAAEDLGDRLKYISCAAVAALGFDSGAAAWAQVQVNLAERARTLQVFGLAPFWFVACPSWPPSAFLVWAGLCAWVQAALDTDRPILAASFSSDQLIVGFADSAEFHDRLSQARQAPVESPLLPLPFLLNEVVPPMPIRKIDLEAGDKVILIPDNPQTSPQHLPLKPVASH